MPKAKIKVLDNQASLMLSIPLDYETQIPKDTISVYQLSPFMLLMSSINMDMTKAKSLPGSRTSDNETEPKTGCV